MTENITVEPIVIDVSLINKKVNNFETLRGAVSAIAQKCNNIKVVDDTTLAMATQTIGEANSYLKTIEDERKIIKAPITKLGKDIDAIADTLKNPLEKGISFGKGQILSYTEEIERKRKEIETNALADQQRQAGIKNRILTIETSLLSKINELASVAGCEMLTASINEKFPSVEAFQEFGELAMTCKSRMLKNIQDKKNLFIAQENVSEDEKNLLQQKAQLLADKQALETREANIKLEEQALQQKKETEAKMAEEALKNKALGSKNLRHTWKFKVVDSSKVPVEYLCVNEAAIKVFMTENKATLKEGEMIPGILFSLEKAIVAR